MWSRGTSDPPCQRNVPRLQHGSSAGCASKYSDRALGFCCPHCSNCGVAEISTWRWHFYKQPPTGIHLIMRHSTQYAVKTPGRTLPYPTLQYNAEKTCPRQQATCSDFDYSLHANDDVIASLREREMPANQHADSETFDTTTNTSHNGAALQCGRNVSLVAVRRISPKINEISREQATVLVKCDTASLTNFSHFLPRKARSARFLTVPSDSLDRNTGNSNSYLAVQAKCLSFNWADVVIIVAPNGCHFDQSATLKIPWRLRGSQKNLSATLFSATNGLYPLSDLNTAKRKQTNLPFWRMVLDSLSGETAQGNWCCPPYEGISREEAADVRKQGFIWRASGTYVRDVRDVRACKMRYAADAEVPYLLLIY